MAAGNHRLQAIRIEFGLLLTHMWVSSCLLSLQHGQRLAIPPPQHIVHESVTLTVRHPCRATELLSPESSGRKSNSRVDHCRPKTPPAGHCPGETKIRFLEIQSCSYQVPLQATQGCALRNNFIEGECPMYSLILYAVQAGGHLVR